MREIARVITEEKRVVIDEQTGHTIIESVPIGVDVDGIYCIPIPNTPHVFDVGKVILNDECFENVRVVMAHGAWRKKNNEYYWSFPYDLKIESVVNGYNKLEDRKPIELVIACSGSLYDLEQGVKIEFPVGFDFSSNLHLPHNVAFLMGDNLEMGNGSVFFPNYARILYVNFEKAMKENFEILESKRIQIRYDW